MKILRTGGWEGELCGRVLKVGGYGGPGVMPGRRLRVGSYAGRGLKAEGVYEERFEGRRLCRAGGYAGQGLRAGV